MQKTIKSIILSLTITAMVILYLPRYTTVDASPVSEELFPYQVWDSANQELWVSDTIFELLEIYPTSGYPFSVSELGFSSSYANNRYYYVVLSGTSNAYILKFVDDYGWSLSTPPTANTRYVTSDYDSAKLFYSSEGKTSSSSLVAPSNLYYSFSYPSSIPSYERLPKSGNFPTDLPESESLDSIINSTTSTTTSAQSAQNSLTTTYNKYLNGTASASTLQNKIDSTVSTLNTLNSAEGNTLADLMAVNNGLTYAQTVQDKLNADELNQHLEVTTSVANNIRGYLNVSNQAFTDYTNGVNSQSETITILQNQIIYLNNMISNGVAKNSADVQAINTAINSVNGIISNVSNYSDLDSDLSDKVQNSDQAELDYLDSLSSDVTSSIQDMSAEKQFSSQQITQSQSILSAVWNLDIVKRLIPLASVFMVVCVALGIRYKL